MSTGWIAARAPAKVNLTLEVLAKRADGYHEIRSWMLAIDLADRLRARAVPGGGVRLAVAGPASSADIPADGRNLAARAAEAVLALARAAGAADAGSGLELELDKVVPSAAGLGGGSSDAAAAWIACAAALCFEPDPAATEAGLARLGSDCVFFEKARAGIGIARGRGEIVEILDGPPPRWWIALATPACGAPTASVYARALPRDPARPSLPPLLLGSASDARRTLCNDLEPAAIAAVPELARWRALLDDVGCGHWRLAGSGSSWFGIHDDEHDARAAVRRVADAARERGLGVRLARVVRAASRKVEPRRGRGPESSACEASRHPGEAVRR